MKIQFLLIQFVALFAWGAVMLSPVSAAIMRPASDETARSCNPRPAEGDIVLPLPNGLSMVFRAVEVDAPNPLSDRQFVSGISSAAKGRSVFERRIARHIGASLRRADLPQAWNVDFGKNALSYYFIAKYEVTCVQWHAVMGGSPAPDEEPDMPKAGITPFEVSGFLQKYNEWLMERHPEVLPAIEGNPAWLRLPTEEEWEYAAVGGIRHAPESVLDPSQYVEQAVFGTKARAPSAVGSRAPNILGLYDMMGNVAELTDSSFSFIVAEIGPDGRLSMRLHGASGAPVARGGSFRGSVPEDVDPGRRDEVKLYASAGEAQGGRGWIQTRDRALGFRPVLAGPVAQGYGRMAGLVKEAEKSLEKAGSPSTAKPMMKNEILELPSGISVDEALRMLYDSTQSSVLKSSILKIRERLAEERVAQEKIRDAELESSLRNAAYQAETVRNAVFRLLYYMDGIEEADPAISESRKSELSREWRGPIRALCRYYGMMLREIAVRDSAKIDYRLRVLLSQYAGAGMLNDHMRENLRTLRKHLQICRKSGAVPDEGILLRDILPQAHFRRISGIM